MILYGYIWFKRLFMYVTIKLTRVKVCYSKLHLRILKNYLYTAQHKNLFLLKKCNYIRSYIGGNPDSQLKQRETSIYINLFFHQMSSTIFGEEA